MSAAGLERVKAQLQEALDEARHLQELVASSQAPHQAVPQAMPRGAEQSAVHTETAGATSQQPQTSREALELSVELEQARQRITTLQQVLSRCCAAYIRGCCLCSD